MSDPTIAKLTRESEMQKRNRWFDPSKGGLPQIPNGDALPPVGPGQAFCLFGLRDAADDTVYVCLKVTGTWTWVSLT